MSSDNKQNETVEKIEADKKTAGPVITDRQLQALSKKHLLMMLRDLEKELALEREEKKYLLLAYKSMQKQVR